MIRHGSTISFAPSTNSSTIRRGRLPASSPASTPSTTKQAAISGIHQSRACTPQAVSPTLPKTHPSTSQSRTEGASASASSPSAASLALLENSFARCASSSAYVGDFRGSRLTRTLCQLTNAIASPVASAQTTYRTPLPERYGTSAMAWAMPTVKGLKKAPPKPTWLAR